MKTVFSFKEYLGEYDDMTGELIVENVFFPDFIVCADYANKYTAKRGFERLVKKCGISKNKRRCE